MKHYDGMLSPVFRKDITKTVFNAHTIEVVCDNKGLGKIEVDIYGVGWIGFYSHQKRNTRTTFTLYLPQEVGFNIREALVNFDAKMLPITKRHVVKPKGEGKREREKSPSN